mmetsp:Transcript_49021/g.66809  ORF Transcript_49021/g.66809 Transcript_49021/m.66809 type:complete len:105 (-) Transcript_49021:100-414(-)
MTDMLALGACDNLHTLSLNGTKATDMSALGACGNLHQLNIGRKEIFWGYSKTFVRYYQTVTDMSILGACSNLSMNNLRTLDLYGKGALHREDVLQYLKKKEKKK